MRAHELPFERYQGNGLLPLHVRATDFIFRLFNVSLDQVPGPEREKKCLRFAIFNFTEKLQNSFEIGLKK